MNWYVILFFVVSIVLYIASKYLRLKKERAKENIEAFQIESKLSISEKLNKYHNLVINYKNATSVIKILLEECQEYIKNMNQPNLLARGATSQAELTNNYNQSLVDISEDERLQVDKFILELLDKIRSRNESYYKYVKSWLGKISLAKGKQSLEAGMPHTLGNIIIMDSDWFQNPRASTLLHELTHVHQRQVPFEFKDLYLQLGYISADVARIRGMESVLKLNRNNPDGLSPNWLWHSTTDNTYWWIGALFTTATPDSLTDVNYVALKIEKDSDGMFYYLKQQPTPLNSLISFNTYFGENVNNYHPNEMSAKFSEWFLEDIIGAINNEKYDKYTGFRTYKTYFTNLINTYYSDS